MSYKFDLAGHSIYALTYHLILVVKYRKQVFTDLEITNTIKEQVFYVAPNYDIKIINQEVDKDHIHILFKATPKTDLVKFINALKGSSSKKIQHRHPQVKKKLWEGTFWSPSYCLITTGQVTLDQLKKYVEEQGKK
jgi:REP element-mobilizing transposase RayT